MVSCASALAGGASTFLVQNKADRPWSGLGSVLDTPARVLAHDITA